MNKKRKEKRESNLSFVGGEESTCKCGVPESRPFSACCHHRDSLVLTFLSSALPTPPTSTTVFTMSSSTTVSPSRSAFDHSQAQGLPTLVTFLHNVPPRLTALLVELGPAISAIRRLAEAASWKSEYSSSWLLLAAWWAMCLLSELTFR